MNHTSTSRAAIAAAAVLVLSACGNSAEEKFLDQGARDIAKAAVKDMREVTSMRILGRMDLDEGMARLDISLDEDSCTGSIDTDDGGFQFVKNGEGAWLKADERFWRSQSRNPQHAEAVLKEYRNKWIAFERQKDLLELCDLDALLDGFELDKDDTNERMDVGEVEKIGDIDAVAINGREGKEHTTAWVSVEAPHHVLKMAPTRDSGETEALFFEDFGLKVVAETPDKKDIASVPSLNI